ncbi:MAG: hypothetical protein FWG85_03470 [Bacteroidetes bacterium]|nr:hypothetical protein [Bacteroidota bacterium]
MQKIVCLIVILICINTFCFAEEKQEENKKEKEYSVAVHLHPVSFILSQTITDSDIKSLALYSTIEIPYSSSFSFIIRPSLYISESDYHKMSLTAISSSGTNDFRLGTDLGIRYYANNDGNSFYVSSTVGLFRTTEEKYNTEYQEITSNSKSFFQADIMVYLGHSTILKKLNISIFFDVGFGLGTMPSSFMFSKKDHGIFDINFGVGYRF